MDEFRHRVLSDGRYQLLAITHRPRYDADDVLGYVVATLAGDRVRDEPTLAMARAWMEQRIAHERASQMTLAPGRGRRR